MFAILNMEQFLFYAVALQLLAPLGSAAPLGWTDWSDWDTCSVTCGTGMQKRVRNCPNAIPLIQSMYCFGDSTEYRSCSPGPCAAVQAQSAVAFQAYLLADRSPNPGDIMIFARTLVNQGGAYKTNTGKFVAPQGGTYTFDAHVCIQHGNIAMSFSIMVGSKTYASTYGRGYEGCQCSSVQAIAMLDKSDEVYVQWKTYKHGTSNVICEGIPWNSFSGVLNF